MKFSRGRICLRTVEYHLHLNKSLSAPQLILRGYLCNFQAYVWPAKGYAHVQSPQLFEHFPYRNRSDAGDDYPMLARC